MKLITDQLHAILYKAYSELDPPKGLNGGTIHSILTGLEQATDVPDAVAPQIQSLLGAALPNGAGKKKSKKTKIPPSPHIRGKKKKSKRKGLNGRG